MGEVAAGRAHDQSFRSSADCSVSGKMANRKAAHEVLVERRVLMAVTVFLLVGLLLWLVAISTDYWGIVDGGKGIYNTKNKRYFLRANTGIWRSCRMAYLNKTKEIVIGTL
ncbi:hypothetical protein Pmani_006049 [Petrolisthes manimaculis]|uniref:Uncharacterized protein n=1 Tax=Petrolisthes manimaculis TaxID=1843537 RepID=A0AAE1UG34_9EUCA|nr:hypothetical protein Pmani_006049 [Petrolisthes manimaculis]